MYKAAGIGMMVSRRNPHGNPAAPRGRPIVGTIWFVAGTWSGQVAQNS